MSPAHSERLWQTYESAHLYVEPTGRSGLLVSRVALGTRSGVFPDEQGRTIHVITAHNPGAVSSAAENARRHHALAVHLQGLVGVEVWRAVGGDPKWIHSEESLAVVGLSDSQACEIGAMFDQDAIFAWSPQYLTVLACDGSRTHITGWKALEGPDPRPELPTSQNTAHRTVPVTYDYRGEGDEVAEDDQDRDPGRFWELPQGVALVEFSYEIDGGSGSPGTDDSGSGCLFIWNGQVWAGFSDPGETELYPIQDVDDAIRRFVTDMRHSLTGADDWIGWGPAADPDLRAQLGPELHIA